VAEPHPVDPLQLRAHGLAFDELKALSEYLDGVLGYADASLEFFRDNESGGYAHRVTPGEGPKTNEYSKASTATCLAYLRAVGGISGAKWEEKAESLRTRIINGSWESAGLGEDNFFTVSFLLDAVDALGGQAGLPPDEQEEVDKRKELLQQGLIDQKGGLKLVGENLPEYPPTAFLTHKAVRVLDRWDALADEVKELVKKWAWSRLYEESMLIDADSPDADFFELAYAALTASRVVPLDRMTPRERRLLQYAIDEFFRGQRADGMWPRSRPLFLYPRIGLAYSYEYEVLVYLLSDPQIKRFLLPHLASLRTAAFALDSRRVPLETASGARAFGWSSEHHGGDFQAESWPTASVYHYCFELGRLVSDAIRLDAFQFVDATYQEPKREPAGTAVLDDLLDSEVDYGAPGVKPSFKEVLKTEFLEPLIAERDLVRDGQPFAKDTKVAAIFYGPPGTSKTQLASRIAGALGWPLLALDPSHLTRRGMDNVHAEADALFGRLRLCDQVVVLLDEFDELVREREAASEVESRFLTTAMLPKIHALYARRRIVYLVATNHLEKFDAAIARPGRFDVIAPVMPPTATAKLENFQGLRVAREVLTKAGDEEAKLDEMIADLTYDEVEALNGRVEGVDDANALRADITRAWDNCTLLRQVREDEYEPKPQPAGKPGAATQAGEKPAPAGAHPGEQAKPVGETWKDRMRRQQSKIRGLGL
jgi:ATPase family associated with various cellular activities (AAA)